MLQQRWGVESQGISRKGEVVGLKHGGGSKRRWVGKPRARAVALGGRGNAC